MEKREHAILSASTAHRWLVCTPSARLEQEEGEGECSVYAEEGTFAHSLAELNLRRKFDKISTTDYEQKLEELKISELGLKYYNKELEEYVNEFVEYVFQRTQNIGDYHIFFELNVSYSNFAPQGFGTADVCIVTDNCIRVIDLKFGAGVPVSAINNPQLRLYGLGALNIFPNSRLIKTTIYQPRLQSCDSEELTKEYLLEWADTIVRPAAEIAIRGEGFLKADEHACRFCKLRGKCKVRADNSLSLAQKEFEIIDTKSNLVQNMSTEKISNILKIAPLFIDWFKDVQTHALGQLIAGVKIPGYKLVEGRSNRIITDEKKVKELLLTIGFEEKDIMKPIEMQGISKLESLIGKKLFQDLCKDYLIKPSGKLTLALEDDKRPEVSTLALAQSDFAAIEIDNEKE